MGFISRKIFPACGNMCVCCPALRSRSRQPVKRYKKLLADIFPKSRDATPNDRKISKLCEYAAKNPIRIPKIVKYLEERCYRELRQDHIQFVNIVTEAYKKMLCTCKQQMVYFSSSLLNVANELLDNSKQDAVKILGCQTLTQFIYSQVDGTYTHNIEKFVNKICKIAKMEGEEHQRRLLRASSLQCISAMVWFMKEFSCVFAALDEVVQVILDNYPVDLHGENDDEGGESHHNWVDEVVRCEGRGGFGHDTGPSCIADRPRFKRKDPSVLTREEIETPKVWAQICIQRMVELGEESTTMRTILEPMFLYFDLRQQWEPRQGVAMMVLFDMCYLMETSGNQHIILAAVIRHLDHKNVSRDPELKSFISQVAAVLAKQVRSGVILSEISFVGDLCRHLRKSIQATLEPAGEQDLTLNILLQNAIEDCLLETEKGIGDATPLFELMTITLEKIPSSGVVAGATIGLLMILAQIISMASISPRSDQVFPEALLDQLLKVMLHPNLEVRVEAHQTFSALLLPSSSRCGVASRPSSANEPIRWRSNNAFAFASISALLKKLRREKEVSSLNKNVDNIHDDITVKDAVELERKQGHTCRSSTNFSDLSSIIDGTAGLDITETEVYILKLTEDQILQLLSAFWLQATLPDNFPSNIEAISHSFMLTLISLRLKNPNNNIVVRCFQLPWALMNLSLDSNNVMLTPAYQRSIFILSLGMLMIAAKIFQIPVLADLLKSLVPYDDPFLGFTDEFQIFARPQAQVRDFGSIPDNQHASSLLLELGVVVCELNMSLMDTMVHNLSVLTKLEADDISVQISEAFSPDDALMLGPEALDLDFKKRGAHSKESLSFDEEILSSSLVEDDTRSEASVTDLSHFIPKISPPSLSHAVSIGKLLESALKVAAQVAATSVYTSPLPYDTMASQCEALGTGTRKKLSNWLAYENQDSTTSLDALSPPAPVDQRLALREITSDAGPVKGGVPSDSYLAMRLPPASPFDNFMKAAGC